MFFRCTGKGDEFLETVFVGRIVAMPRYDVEWGVVLGVLVERAGEFVDY